MNIDEMDANHSWHPFTQMQEYLEKPRIQIDRGLGSWLWDTNGKKYMDASASIWTNVHGHNHPELNKAITDQLNKVAHSTMLGVTHPLASKLSQKLTQLSPPALTRCFFSDNGSNAVEIALKMSFQYWQLKGKNEKVEVLGLEDAYHGDTFGTMSVGDCGDFHKRFQPWFFSSNKIPRPTCDELSGVETNIQLDLSLNALETKLSKDHEKIACFIMEPSVQGSAGMQLHPKSYLKKASQLCKKYKVHLIVDEVFVGFGRLGSLLISTKEEIQPDFICCAKGLTAGYIPLAATLTTEKIFSTFLGKFSEFKTLFHGHTFTGNPLGCAVALKSIELLENKIHTTELNGSIQCFAKHFMKFKDQVSFCSKHARQRGMVAAVDLHPPFKAEEKFPLDLRFGSQVCLEARKHNLLLRPLGDSLLIVPPLCITKDEISELFSNLVLSINKTLSQLKQ